LNEVDVLMSLSSQLSSIYASAGYPSIIVPAGFRESGEPLGVTFTASARQERLLVEIAKRYEQATQYRRVPREQFGTTVV
jgi:amidase